MKAQFLLIIAVIFILGCAQSQVDIESQDSHESDEHESMESGNDNNDVGISIGNQAEVEVTRSEDHS